MVKRMPQRPAFYLDAQICTGCKTCMVACKDKNDLPLGVRWRRVVEYTGGQWRVMPDGTYGQDVFSYYISLSCNHCAEPICVEVCPTSAMNQDENGIVSIDPARCMGCGYCEWACPYSAPQYQTGRGQMSKCDFCRDELKAGNAPACVAACPTRALDFGELDDLQQKAGRHQTMAPLPDQDLTAPGAVFKPHKMSKPLNSPAGYIANPEETKDA
jgi:anaerobic dimethyl sulfoxide reductase subunit B (iron-sulfur subunit)